MATATHIETWKTSIVQSRTSIIFGRIENILNNAAIYKAAAKSLPCDR